MVDPHADYSRLAEVVSGLGLHEHLCVIYDNEEQQFAGALPYLRAGVERGEKCLYFADENTAAAVLDALRKFGTDVDQYVRSGALTITHQRETDLQQGHFDPDWWIGFLNQATAEAGAAKFSVLRILGDMSWALRGSNSKDKLIEFEGRFNYFVRDHDVRAICQYNRNRNSPELILSIIRTHPLLVYGGIVSKNPYYVPPDEFLKPSQAAQEVERLLNNIVAWERAQQALRHSEERLRLVIDTVPALIHAGRPDGSLDFFNQRWLKFVGLSLEDLLDCKWTALIHPEDVQAMLDGWRAALATGEPFEHESRVRRADGEYRWMVHRDVPLRDERGKIVKWYASSIDIEDRKRAEDALQRNEDRLRLIIDTIPTMAWSVLPDGALDFLNRRWLDYTGLSLEEALKDPTSTVHPEDLPGVMEEWRAAMAIGKPVEHEMRLRRADGEYRWFLVRTVPLRDERGDIVKWFGTSTEIEDRKRAEKEQYRSFEQLRALTARMQSVREEERARVAREIHDELGQALTGIKLESASLLRELPGDAKQQSNRAESILKLADETIQAVRRISTELRPGILDDLGLVAAVEWVAQEFEARTGTKCRLDLPKDDIAVDQELATALFRILQETLTNVARHANATQVNIRLAKEGGVLVLEVHDNGRGISEEELSAGRSLGILGMRERVLLLGGELTIKGVPGKSTTVRVRIPEAHRARPE
jgi:PAS domain S-box-containing protein